MAVFPGLTEDEITEKFHAMTNREAAEYAFRMDEMSSEEIDIMKSMLAARFIYYALHDMCPEWDETQSTDFDFNVWLRDQLDEPDPFAGPSGPATPPDA